MEQDGSSVEAHLLGTWLRLAGSRPGSWFGLRGLRVPWEAAEIIPLSSLRSRSGRCVGVEALKWLNEDREEVGMKGRRRL